MEPWSKEKGLLEVEALFSCTSCPAIVFQQWWGAKWRHYRSSWGTAAPPPLNNFLVEGLSVIIRGSCNAHDGSGMGVLLSDLELWSAKRALSPSPGQMEVVIL